METPSPLQQRYQTKQEYVYRTLHDVIMALRDFCEAERASGSQDPLTQ